MANLSLDFNVEQANTWLMRVLAVEGITGQEKAKGQDVTVLAPPMDEARAHSTLEFPAVCLGSLLRLVTADDDLFVGGQSGR